MVFSHSRQTGFECEDRITVFGKSLKVDPVDSQFWKSLHQNPNIRRHFSPCIPYLSGWHHCTTLCLSLHLPVLSYITKFVSYRTLSIHAKTENEFSFLDVRKPSVLVSLQIQLIIPLNICFILFSPSIMASVQTTISTNVLISILICQSLVAFHVLLTTLSWSIRLTSAKLANLKWKYDHIDFLLKFF